MSSTGHTRSHTGTIHHQRTRGHHSTPCERLASFYMLSTLRLSHHIRRGKLARTWTTPKGRATPEAQPRQQARASRGKSPLARRVGAPTPQRNASEKKNTNAGHPAKENKKIFTGPFELNFSLRCLRAQKLARLIEKF